MAVTLTSKSDGVLKLLELAVCMMPAPDAKGEVPGIEMHIDSNPQHFRREIKDSLLKVLSRKDEFPYLAVAASGLLQFMQDNEDHSSD